jgi:hypothetical protein
MKPLNKSEQSRRFMRWFRYGTLIGFGLALLDFMLNERAAVDTPADGDVLASRLIVFFLIIVLSGVAGGLMAIIASWVKR